MAVLLKMLFPLKSVKCNVKAYRKLIEHLAIFQQPFQVKAQRNLPPD